MHPDIASYHAKQSPGDQAICECLHQEISLALPDAESKLWHGAPVWFLDGNPIVGYHHLKAGMRLMFWSGQSFSTPGLKVEGTFKAATYALPTGGQIDLDLLRRWLQDSREIQWDYVNIVKRKGELVRLK